MANFPYYNPYQPAYSAQPTYPIAQSPVPPIPQPQQQTQNGIIWVTDINEAMGFQVLPNAAVALWDSNNPCIYLKQADQTGKPTMRIYDLVERVQPVQTQAAAAQRVDFITREEFEDLVGRVDRLSTKTGSKKKEDAE